MIRESVSVQDAIDFLNDLVKVDPKAVEALVGVRVPCNEDLADHPTVQVGVKDGKAEFGLLGVLNGLFGAYPDEPRKGWGPILMVASDDASPRFVGTRGFYEDAK